MDKTKNYVIQNQKLSQGELTLGQMKKLIRKLGSVEFPENLESTSAIIEFLLENKILGEVLDIIVNGGGQIDWDAAPLSVIEEIVRDFLSFNGGLIKRLAGYLQSLSAVTKLPTNGKD